MVERLLSISPRNESSRMDALGLFALEPKFARPSSSRLWVITAAAILAACVLPWLPRLGHPSLFADDIQRIGHAREFPFRALIAVPFNEHVAPLFQLVTWAAWKAAFGRLTSAPMTFTIAAYIPFVFTLVLLYRVLKRELDSTPAALFGLVLFSTSSVYDEAVMWYSGSSFMWALAAALAAYLCAIRACGKCGRNLGLTAAAVASMLAPAFSGVGILAGPFAAIRIATGSEALGSTSLRTRLLRSFAPLAGLAAYLAFYAAFRRFSPSAIQTKTHMDFVYGLWFVVRGPVDLLFPSLLGLIRAPTTPYSIAALVSTLFSLGCFALAIRFPRLRALVLGGLWLISAGYLLTFSARSEYEREWAIQAVRRYHLFPMLGFALILSATAARLGSKLRFDRRLALPLVLAAAVWMLVVGGGNFRKATRFYRFEFQLDTLTAIDRLDQVRLKCGYTYQQVFEAFEPIRTRWSPYPVGGSVFVLLSRTMPSTGSTDVHVRERLLERLDSADVEFVCSGIDVSRNLVVENGKLTGKSFTVGKLVRAVGVSLDPQDPHRFISKGFVSFLEFDLGADAGHARYLQLPIANEPGRWEIWWTSDKQDWSIARSVNVERGKAALDRGGTLASQSTFSVLPLESVPHWAPSLSKGPERQVHLRVIARTGRLHLGDEARVYR